MSESTFNNIDDVKARIDEVDVEMQESFETVLVSTKATLQVLGVLIDKVNELVAVANAAGVEINKITVIDPEEDN